MKIDVKKGGKAVAGFVDVIQEYGAKVVISLIVLGILFGVATDGSITGIQANFTSVLTTLASTVSGYFTTLSSSMSTVITLIIVAVLAYLFGMKWSGSSKGSRM